MPRLTIPAREAAPAASQPLLDAVETSLGVVALNVFTNFVNNVAETEIDFPLVRAAEAA
jgi:hypothetical protein